MRGHKTTLGKASIDVFGSYCMGLSTFYSDLDISINGILDSSCCKLPVTLNSSSTVESVYPKQLEDDVVSLPETLVDSDNDDEVVIQEKFSDLVDDDFDSNSESDSDTNSEPDSDASSISNDAQLDMNLYDNSEVNSETGLNAPGNWSSTTLSRINVEQKAKLLLPSEASTNESQDNKWLLGQLQGVFKYLKCMDYIDVMEIRSKAKVPIINMMHKNGVECDISIGIEANNTTNLIRTMVLTVHNYIFQTQFVLDLDIKTKHVQELKLQRIIKTIYFPIMSFIKIFLTLASMDKPYCGGIGAYKLYIMLTKVLLEMPLTVFYPNISNKATFEPDLGLILCCFFEYYGKPAHLNNNTEIIIPTGYNACNNSTNISATFESHFKIDYCCYLFHMSSMILSAVAEYRKRDINNAAFPSSKLNEQYPSKSVKLASSTLGYIINIQRLYNDRYISIKKSETYNNHFNISTDSSNGFKLKTNGGAKGSKEGKSINPLNRQLIMHELIAANMSTSTGASNRVESIPKVLEEVNNSRINRGNEVLRALYNRILQDNAINNKANYAVFTSIKMKEIADVDSLLYLRLKSCLNAQHFITSHKPVGGKEKELPTAVTGSTNNGNISGGSDDSDDNILKYAVLRNKKRSVFTNTVTASKYDPYCQDIPAISLDAGRDIDMAIRKQEDYKKRKLQYDNYSRKRLKEDINLKIPAPSTQPNTANLTSIIPNNPSNHKVNHNKINQNNNYNNKNNNNKNNNSNNNSNNKTDNMKEGTINNTEKGQGTSAINSRKDDCTPIVKSVGQKNAGNVHQTLKNNTKYYYKNKKLTK